MLLPKCVYTVAERNRGDREMNREREKERGRARDTRLVVAEENEVKHKSNR